MAGQQKDQYHTTENVSSFILSMGGEEVVHRSETTQTPINDNVFERNYNNKPSLRTNYAPVFFHFLNFF